MESTNQTQDAADRTLREYCQARVANRLRTGRAKPKLFSDGGPEVREALRKLDARHLRKLEVWWGEVTDAAEKALLRRRAQEKQDRAQRREVAKAKRAERKIAKDTELAAKQARKAGREADRAKLVAEKSAKLAAKRANKIVREPRSATVPEAA